MVQHPGFVCPRFRPLPSHCLPQTLQDIQVELFIDCLTTWNKLIMNNTLPIKKKLSTSPSHLSDSDVLFFGHGDNFPIHCDDCTFVSTSQPYNQVSSPVDIFQKVFISIRRIKQFLTDCDMVLFLCVCQQTRHKFCSNTTHLQFVGQNQVALIFTDSYFFGNFTDSQAMILTKHSKHFLNVVVIH